MSDWVRSVAFSAIEPEGVVRFDHGGKTYAIYRSAGDEVFCSDGLCSHEAVHLADGFVMDYEVECPKHSGAFDIRTGNALRLPACKNLKTYETRVEGDTVLVRLG
jgi:3-phenylpropionate/trans-cinnamate dioxygenase ferredoxin subunit